jgi:hypothetical protein
MIEAIIVAAGGGDAHEDPTPADVATPIGGFFLLKNNIAMVAWCSISPSCRLPFVRQFMWGLRASYMRPQELGENRLGAC